MKKYLVLAPFMAMSLIVSCQSNASKATTIYAADDNKIEIIFDASAGVYDDGLHARSMKFMKGYTWKDIKTVAPGAADIDCGDSIFNEWKYNGQPISDNDPFNENKTLVADYTVIQRINITVDPDPLPVLEPDTNPHGHWDDDIGGSNPRTFVAIKGETWGKYYDSYVVAADAPLSYEFKYWTVNDGTEAITNTYELKDGDVIKANFGTLDTTTSFANDSWPIFINALNKGLGDGTTTGISGLTHENGGYHEEYISTEGKAANTFVGLERTIRIYNKDYKVRVIGEDIDPITDKSGNATLTFQFVDAIENAVGWNYKDDNDYVNASIRTYLNEQFIDALPDDIIESIVPVDKYTYEGGETGENVIKTSEMMFLPSLMELNISTFTVGGLTVTAKNEGLGDNHTEAYAYYNEASEGDDLKKQYNEVDCNYWLRSPDEEGFGQAWYVDNNGIIGSDEGSYSTQYGLGIAPCFALGDVTL